MKCIPAYAVHSAVIICLLASCSNSSRDLFNGRDLSGWDTYLGPRFDAATRTWDSLAVPGLNNDPDKVFTVVQEDGEGAIRISGQHFGGISTKDEFSDYHLTLEFKWGQDKYAPKDSSARDSGLLYHAVGAHGAGDRFWLRSQEFQVQEGDCGDYWGVAGAEFDIPASLEQGEFVYDDEAEPVEFTERTAVGRHAVKFPDAEKSSGEWNVLELYCVGGDAVHVVNGQVVMKLFNSRQVTGGDETTPLTKGKIQIQSEGAEVFYRRIKIERLDALPQKIGSTN
jgi:hypothetical protein